MAYSPTELPAKEGKWEIDLPEDDGVPGGKGRTRQFTVSIRFTRTIDLSKLGVFVRGKQAAGGEPMPDVSDVQSAIQARTPFSSSNNFCSS
jgi:eukaryotic translation initiation factor 2C